MIIQEYQVQIWVGQITGTQMCIVGSNSSSSSSSSSIYRIQIQEI